MRGRRWYERPRTTTAPCALPLCAALLAGGCTATLVPPTEADRNRERVFELEGEVRRLETRVSELEAGLAVAAKAAAPTGGPSAEALATAPFATELRIGRFSGLVDEDGDGQTDTLRLYLEPRDGRGSVVQTVGRTTVELLEIGLDGASTPRFQRTLEPTAWRDAFTSGFMGSSYAVDGAVGPGRDDATLLVRVVHEDLLTGRTLTAQRLLERR